MRIDANVKGFIPVIASRRSMNEYPLSLWETLAVFAGTPWPLHSADDADRFLLAADRHRLLQIAAASDSLPPALREAAQERALVSRKILEAQIREHDELLALLRRILGWEWLMLKGADYRERLYSSPLLRPMNDVDILVRRRDAAATVATLREAGFEVMPGKSSVNETALRAPNSDLWLDVYDRFAHDARVDVSYDEIWAEYETTDSGASRLAAHHALAAHTLILANLQFVTHLRKFVDLWLLSRNAEVMGKAMGCARRWSLRRSFYASFRILRQLFPETAAEPWSRDVDHLVGSADRARLDPMIGGAPFPSLPRRPVQIWRKLRLLDTRRHRFRFVATHMAETAMGEITALTRRGG